MTCLPGDPESDRALKYDPEKLRDILREPLPSRRVTPAPLELFNIESDPSEKSDLAPVERDRVARMLAGLERWFEQVEADRGQIRDERSVTQS